jgi:hypothetical protein
LTKTGRDTFWAIFPQTHPVALIATPATPWFTFKDIFFQVICQRCFAPLYRAPGPFPDRAEDLIARFVTPLIRSTYLKTQGSSTQTESHGSSSYIQNVAKNENANFLV